MEKKSAILILALILLPLLLVSCQTTTNQTNPISQEAKARVGTYYNKGRSKQCAKFVSDVLSKKGYNVNYSFAQDFRKIGQKVSSPKSGDILLFAGTYNGPNYITHVGIYDGGYVIHRPTFNGLVIKEPLPNRLINHLVEIRRL